MTNDSGEAAARDLYERLLKGMSVCCFQNTPAQYRGRPELTEAHTAEIEEVRAGAARLSADRV